MLRRRRRSRVRRLAHLDSVDTRSVLNGSLAVPRFPLTSHLPVLSSYVLAARTTATTDATIRASGPTGSTGPPAGTTTLSYSLGALSSGCTQNNNTWRIGYCRSFDWSTTRDLGGGAFQITCESEASRTSSRSPPPGCLPQLLLAPEPFVDSSYSDPLLVDLPPAPDRLIRLRDFSRPL